MPSYFCRVCEKLFKVDGIDIDPYTFKCEECNRLCNGDYKGDRIYVIKNGKRPGDRIF